MPTTSVKCSSRKNLKRLPTASSSGQNCRAIVSLIDDDLRRLRGVRAREAAPAHERDADVSR